METYKNILIRETHPTVIAGIKAVIDHLFTDDHYQYEVITEMATLNDEIVYKTCLSEDNDRYMSVVLPDSFDVIVTFSDIPETDNNNDITDCVYNCNDIMQAIEILSNYYTPADMGLITSIEIKPAIN